MAAADTELWMEGANYTDRHDMLEVMFLEKFMHLYKFWLHKFKINESVEGRLISPANCASPLPGSAAG